jgi:hypothetical protein
MIVSASCATAFLLAGLLLPAADGADRARVTGAFVTGAVFFLACLGGALLPASLVAANRHDRSSGGWSAFPGGKASFFVGAYLASGVLLAFWTAFLFAVSAGVLLFAFADLPDGENPLAPRREFFPQDFPGRTLTPGESLTVTFPPLHDAEVAGPTVEGRLDVRLILAHPEAEVFGAPLTLSLLARDGTVEALSALPNPASTTGSVPFRIPARRAMEGHRLEIRFGPSPFRAEFPTGGIRYLGAPRSFWGNYILAAGFTLLATLFLASVSASGASTLSLPVAVGLAGWVFLAGLISPEAADALAEWEHAGLMRAKEGVPDLPAWFGTFRFALEGLIGILPRVDTLNRASDIAGAKWIAPAELARSVLHAVCYALPALLVGLLLSARGREDRSE